MNKYLLEYIEFSIIIMNKNACLYFYFFFFALISVNNLRNLNKSGYIRKKKLKLPEFTEWNVPDEPSIYYSYLNRDGV